VHQARRLKERDERLYNIALVGAEILGMQTHECRDSWTPERWVEWIRNQFVCKKILINDYSSDIEDKFKMHCRSCDSKNLVKRFEREFKHIVEQFSLQSCAFYANESGADLQNEFGEGRWLSAHFVPWDKLEREGLHAKSMRF
jgi:hypothetical protein